jgi:glutamine synthetase
MLTDKKRLALGVTRELPRNPDEAFQALLEDELLVDSIGKELLTMYVTIQELYNKKLADVGPEGSPERKAWLTARI